MLSSSVSVSLSSSDSSSASPPSSASSVVMPSAGAYMTSVGKSYMKFFSLLVPDELLDVAVEQTNLYAEQFFEREDVPPTSRVHKGSHSRLDLMVV